MAIITKATRGGYNPLKLVFTYLGAYIFQYISSSFLLATAEENSLERQKNQKIRVRIPVLLPTSQRSHLFSKWYLHHENMQMKGLVQQISNTYWWHALCLPHSLFRFSPSSFPSYMFIIRKLGVFIEVTSM